MHAISATYDALRRVIEVVVEKLEALPDEEAQKMASEGRDVVIRWLLAEPVSEERDAATQGMIIFQKKALDFLTHSSNKDLPR